MDWSKKIARVLQVVHKCGGSKVPPSRKQEYLPKRILVIRLDEVGDFVLTTPLLRELRKSYPSSRIVLIVKKQSFSLAQPCPYADRVLSVDLGQEGRHPGLLRLVGLLMFAIIHLWKERFDLVLSPRWDFDLYGASFLTYASLAKRRIGHSENNNMLKKNVNAGYDIFFTETVQETIEEHEVERTLAILKHLGKPIRNTHLELWEHATDREQAQKILKDAFPSENSAPLVCLGIGGRDAKRHWPSQHYAQLIMDTKAYRFLIVGGPEDRQEAEAILSRLENSHRQRCTSAMGETFRTTLALIRHCCAYLGNDTATMHMAAAAGLATVEISCWNENAGRGHLNSPFRFGPWKVPFEVLTPAKTCSGCEKGCQCQDSGCIQNVDVERAKTALKKLTA